MGACTSSAVGATSPAVPPDKASSRAASGSNAAATTSPAVEEAPGAAVAAGTVEFVLPYPALGAAKAARSLRPGTNLTRAICEGNVFHVVRLLEKGGGALTPRVLSSCDGGGSRRMTPPSPNSGRRRSISVALRGEPVDRPDHGLSPLCWAAMAGHQEVIEVLIRSRANVRFVTADGLSPLFLAAHRNRVAAVWTLMAGGSPLPAALASPSNSQAYLCLRDSLPAAAFEAMRQWSVRPEVPSKCAAAVRSELLALSEELFVGRLAALACCYGRAQTMRDALDTCPALAAGYRDPASGSSLLSFAAQHGHAHLVAELAARGAGVDDENEGGATPLIRAAQGGHAVVAAELLRLGADPTRGPPSGWTALMSASLRGCEDTCRVLLDGGANPSASTAMGRTPLLIAAASSHAGVVRMLLEAGADTSARTSEGLGLAEFASSPDVIEATRRFMTRAAAARAAADTADAASTATDAEAPEDGFEVERVPTVYVPSPSPEHRRLAADA